MDCSFFAALMICLVNFMSAIHKNDYFSQISALAIYNKLEWNLENTGTRK